MDQPQVIKRDGSIEPFDRMKIVRVLHAAGLNDEETEKVVDYVQSWIIMNRLETFKSLEIRDRILEQLPTLNPSVASLYQWYEGTKDVPEEETVSSVSQ